MVWIEIRVRRVEVDFDWFIRGYCERKADDPDIAHATR